MGLDISGGINNSNDAITNLSNLGVNRVKDGLNDLFDIENPDGVNAQIRVRNNENSLKSSNVEDSSLNIAAIGKEITQENRGTIDGDVFYQDDIKSVEYDSGDGTMVGIGPRPHAVFNKFSLVNFRGSILDSEGSSVDGKSQYYNKIDPQTLINPTASKIISMTDALGGLGYKYGFADFALTKYFGKIPNNMMITLRRFAYPVSDDIISPKGLSGENIPQPDIARAVTWMGESTGNGLSSILNFSHGYNWEDIEAKTETVTSMRGKKSGRLGSFIQNDRLLSAAANASNGVGGYDAAVKQANAGFDAFSQTYPNHVFGPLNVIKNVLQRKEGLKFDQEFTLKFEYELRDLGGANPKLLMLDQLANILALTYNNAPFWGGAVRYIGDGSITRPLGKIEKLRSGDFGGYLKSVVSGLTGKSEKKTGSGALEDIVDSVTGFFDGGMEGNAGKTLKNLLGGGMAALFNSPQGGQYVNALLTGDPTGQWHVTIGNPLNPIAVMGNLACTDTKVNFEGAMGVQDFPEKMVVEVTLKPGRPRDKAEIESMFNAGRGRFYIQPADGSVDINDTENVNVYGKSSKGKLDNISRKISNG